MAFTQTVKTQTAASVKSYDECEPSSNGNTTAPKSRLIDGKSFPTWGSFAPIQVNLTEYLLSNIAENAAEFPTLVLVR